MQQEKQHHVGGRNLRFGKLIPSFKILIYANGQGFLVIQLSL